LYGQGIFRVINGIIEHFRAMNKNKEKPKKAFVLIPSFFQNNEADIMAIYEV